LFSLEEFMRYPPATYSSICFRRLSDVAFRKTNWLWDHWLPLGKTALLEGDTGLGKSLLTLDLCARVTTGRPWPDGTAPVAPCNVAMLNGEDNVQDTVRPRLQALGADLDRVFFVDGVADQKGEEPLRLPGHALALRAVVEQTQAKLLVVDPFVDFLDKKVNVANDQSVRPVLALLAGLAHELQCAVLLVRHLNKNESQRALYRGSGSIGLLAAVRCGALLARDPHQPGRRILAPVKNNMGPLPASLSFAISGAKTELPQLSWQGASPLTHEQLLERKRGRGRPATQRERAQENLKLFLQESPRTLDDVQEFAMDQRISERTLDRVKQLLGVRSVRAPHGDRRSTFWLLPGQLPANVSEDMLVALDTHEAQMRAHLEDSEYRLRDLCRLGGATGTNG
jgi:hypothetical protein